jgi:alcohol dehydrogenase class IV
MMEVGMLEALIPKELILPKIVFGLGAVRTLAAHANDVSEGEILIITDGGLMKSGVVDRIRDLLSSSGRIFSVFDGVESDPCIENVEQCLIEARAKKPGLIVGVGGGSSLDVAKVAAALAGEQGSIRRYFGHGKITKKGVPTILIPTTAGTGTEVAIGAVVSDHQERLKKGILSPHLLCDVAILDPELTVSCPRSVTASAGLDALTHAIEVYTNRKALKLVDPIVLAAIGMIGHNIRSAYKDGSNIVARSELLLASMYAGIGMQAVNNAAVHALSAPLGAFYEVPHGAANSFLLPYVMNFNKPACIEKYSMVARLMIAKCSEDLEENTALLVNEIKSLSRDLGIGTCLSDISIRKNDIPKMARLSLKVWLMANNPREVTLDDAVSIYEEAFAEEGISVVS